MPDPSRPCPACGVANPRGRELCGACGVDLGTGAALPTATRGEAPDPPQPEERPTEHHRWIVPLVAVLVGAALLVAGLTWAGFGPFAGAPDVPDATFDTARYDPEPGDLPLANIAASSAADGAAAAAVADGDAATAWRTVPGATAADSEVRAALELGLDTAGWVDRVVLRNGDQADTEAYADAARPSRVRLVTDAGEVVLADLLDLGLQPQELVFPEPLLVQELRVEVLEVFGGTGEGVVAISEIELAGWDADAEDAELARERRDAAVPGGIGSGAQRRQAVPGRP